MKIKVKLDLPFANTGSYDSIKATKKVRIVFKKLQRIFINIISLDIRI